MFAHLLNKGGEKSAAGLLVEVLMIIIGINVALWFEGWFEDRREREAERQYLIELRADLAANIADLDHVIEQNRAKAERLREILRNFADLPVAEPEVQATTIFEPSSYSFFEPSDVTYQALLESGDFRLITDPKVKKGLLRLSRRWNEIDTLQNNYLQALDDGYIPMMMASFDILEMRVSDESMFADQSFRNFFPYALQDTERLVQFYESAKQRAATVQAAIDASLADD